MTILLEFISNKIKYILVNPRMAHSSVSSSSTSSGWNKVLKDFVLGGTSGAIAKTIAAPIERVKLLLQTQANNPKLADRPYTGTTSNIQALLIASGAVSKKRALFLFGEVTGLMFLGISPRRLLTSRQKTRSTASS